MTAVDHKALADLLAEALGEAVEALEPYSDADQPDPTLPPQANKAMLALATAAEALAAYDAACPDPRGAMTAEAAR